MKKKKKKIEISTSIFVTASIVNLIILALFFSSFRSVIFKNRENKEMICPATYTNYVGGISQSGDNYNSSFDTSDPYITKSPTLKK